MFILRNSFLFFKVFKKSFNEKLLLKSNTEGLSLVKENTDKEVLHEDIFSEEL